LTRLFNHFTKHLDGEPLTQKSRTPHRVESFYAEVEPTPGCQPKLVALSEELAQSLGLSVEWLRSKQGVNLLSGCAIADGAKPYAMNYGGHQFGHWAGQLGDGRAINLGEMLDSSGNIQTLQLKGAGMTPFSRHADGLAVLRSSLREFLCSEAMHYLGVPTTRALSLCLSGEMVWRDMFYDGNPEQEPGAVVCRVAPSFLRFGNFQLFAARKDQQRLKKLLQYVLQHHATIDSELTFEQQVVHWFRQVCAQSCQLVVEWTRVGFVHGVLNTDNMSILGLTIDYGPYGWMEAFDPTWTPNTTDAEGKRYCFGQQPQIVHWNLYQLANALALVVSDHDTLLDALHQFNDDFAKLSLQMYAKKLGLDETCLQRHAELIEDMFSLLYRLKIDWSLFFLKLRAIRESNFQSLDDDSIIDSLSELSYRTDDKLNPLDKNASQEFKKWLQSYRQLCEQNQQSETQALNLMAQNNPRYIVRNYMAQQAIDKAHKGDFEELYRLQAMIKQPYRRQKQFEDYVGKAPAWAKNKAGCSMLSCSS